MPQGAGKAPKRDPEQRTGYEAEGSPMHQRHSTESRRRRARTSRSLDPARHPFLQVKAASSTRTIALSRDSEKPCSAFSETSWVVQPD